MKKIYRSRKNKRVGGVCGGIAEYFGWDPTLVRLGAVILIFIWGAGILAYIAAWAIIPERPSHIDVDYDVSSEPVYEEQPESENKSDHKNGDNEEKYHDI
ncbi:MAG: PspC domain-containing protein [Halanaerobium sp.]